VFLLISVSILLIMCSKETEIKEYYVSGKAQKGPFARGTDVMISELDADLYPTGKYYFSEVLNNEGYFKFPKVEFASSYAQLEIEGHYYHESRGTTFTNEPITLYCIADLSQANITNPNILTHLEKDRLIKYKQEGLSFDEAKNKAQEEVLAIFNLDNYCTQNSEELNIFSLGDDNGILLAITIIIQGRLRDTRLIDFMNRIRYDLNDNGILNSEDIQTQLISTANLLNSAYTWKIRENMDNYYNGWGIEYEIPQFERYIDTFLIKSQFISTTNYTTPESTINGINLLNIEDDTIYVNTTDSYSLSVYFDINSNIGCGAYIMRMEGNDDWYELSNISNWEIENLEQNLLKPLIDINHLGMELNLPLSNKIIEGHGGSLSLKSEGGINTFIITLPVIESSNTDVPIKGGHSRGH